MSTRLPVASNRTGRDLYISFRTCRRGVAPNLGPPVSTDGRSSAVLSPDGRHLYLTSDRSRVDKPAEAALSSREWSAHLDGPDNGLGDTWRVPMWAVIEALGRTPR